VLGAGLRADVAERFLAEATFKFLDVLTDQDLRLNRLNFAFGARF
jgi:hypothetical protein